MKAAIEKAGGRTAGSVSSKTSYLVNNDSSSGSSKNKKAKQLGVPVITEDELLRMLSDDTGENVQQKVPEMRYRPLAIKLHILYNIIGNYANVNNYIEEEITIW